MGSTAGHLVVLYMCTCGWLTGHCSMRESMAIENRLVVARGHTDAMLADHAEAAAVPMDHSERSPRRPVSPA